MRILVTGSRDWTDYQTILKALYAKNPTLVIEGEQRGADLLARKAADALGVPFLPFKANWDLFGKSAGRIRNQQMLDEGKPDLVLAFPLPQSRGTWHMVEIARKAAIPVKIFAPETVTK